jgi:hypothetical protein
MIDKSIPTPDFIALCLTEVVLLIIKNSLLTKALALRLYSTNVISVVGCGFATLDSVYDITNQSKKEDVYQRVAYFSSLILFASRKVQAGRLTSNLTSGHQNGYVHNDQCQFSFQDINSSGNRL